LPAEPWLRPEANLAANATGRVIRTTATRIAVDAHAKGPIQPVLEVGDELCREIASEPATALLERAVQMSGRDRIDVHGPRPE
jgi:hypothetical protein